MSAETMKMPEPIIEPATSAVASTSPRRASRWFLMLSPSGWSPRGEAGRGRRAALAARAGARRPLVRPLGTADGSLGAAPADRPHLHRAARGRGAHGTLALRLAHVRGIAALVLGARLRRTPAGGELAPRP